MFYDRAQALEKVSIHVHRGEFVAVVGLNGAGKTTLFNAISGLVPHGGDIRREGVSLGGKSAAEIARGGIVQAPEGRELFTDMTVSRKSRHGRPAADRRANASSNCELCSNCFLASRSGAARPRARFPAASSRC